MNPKKLCLLILAAIGCIQLTASATSFTWNNGAANLQWDTTSLNWSGSTWTNAITNSATFGATGVGTVTLSSAITNNGITFNTNGYIITGNTLTLGGTTPTITANSNAAINSVIAGAAGLTKAGAGTLTLGATNTYTGASAVTAGTLAVGNVTLANGSTNTVAAGAAISSAGTLKMNAYGSAQLTAVSGAGVLRLTATGNSASSPDISFNPNDTDNSTANYGNTISSTVDLGTSQRYIFGKSNHNGVDQYAASGKAECMFTGAITNSGGLTFIAQDNYAGSNPIEVPFYLGAANTFTGPVEIQRGSVYLGNAAALVQTNILRFNPGNATNNARFYLYGNNAVVADLQSAGTGTNAIANSPASSATTSQVGPATLTVFQNNPYTFTGSIVDFLAEYPKAGALTPTLSLVKNGAATLTLAGNNTYTGPTTISAGALQIGGTLGNGAYSALITNNAILAFNSSGNQTLSGAIFGTGALTKTNTGTLTLSGTNTFSGGTALNGGSISIANGSALGTGTLNVGLTASGTLTIANTNPVTVNNNLVLPAPGSAVTFNIVKNSSTKSTGTQLTLAGTISGGNASTTLFLNSSTSSDNTTTYLFTGTNTFQVNEINLNRGSIVVANPASLGNPANLVYLDGNNNSTLGDLRFAASMTFPNPIQFVSGGSSYVGTDTNNVLLTGAVSGANLYKLGSGTLTLSAANTYSGNTTVSAGTLALSGSATIASTPLITLAGSTLDVSALASPFVLGGSQTLQGSGNVTGDFQDSGGSIFTPGGTTNVGTLHFGGNLTLAGADTLNFDLGKTPTSVGGTNNDLITVASNLTINAGTTVNINPILALAGGTYKLISYSGTLNGAGNTATWTVGSYTPSGRVTGVAISEATPGEIDLVVTGSPAPLVWKGDGSVNAWDVQTTTNWLNLAAPDYFYQFDNVTFTDTGSNSPAVDIQAAVTPSSVVVSNTQPYIFNSSVSQGIGGGCSLTKSGTGTLTILNNNPYTGVTTVNNGTLVLGDGGSNDGAISGSPIANNSTLEFNVASAQTAATAISGSGTVVQAGNVNGTLTLNASNSWTGGLNIQNGTTKPGVNYALPAGEVVNISSGAAYDFNGIVNGSTANRNYTFAIAGTGPDGVSGALVNSGVQVLSYASVSNLILSADATVGGSNGRWDVGPTTNSMLNGQGHNLTKTGSVLLDMRPQIVTNVASITVNSGELRYESYNQTNAWTSTTTNNVTSGAAIGSYGVTVNYPMVLDNGTLQSDSGTATWLGNVNLISTSIFSTATGAQIFDGVVSGAPSLTIQGGTGSVTLAAANTYTGGTTINAGTLVVANTNALSTGDVTINAGSLYFNFPSGTTSVVTNNISLPATGTEEFTIQGPTNFTTVRLTGLISGGTAGLQYNFADTGVTGNHSNILVLDNANNTFAGNILMNRGTLAFTSDAALGNAGTIVHDTWSLNGALRFDADNITINASRTINLHTIAQVMPINVQGYHGTIDSVISGPGTLVKQGAGTLTLTAANTYTGNTTISAGTLQVSGSIGTNTVAVQSGAALCGAGTVNGATTLQTGGAILGGDPNYTNTLTIAAALNLGNNTNALTYSNFKIATGGIVSATKLNVTGTNVINILDASLSIGTNTLITYGGGSIGGTNGFAGLQLGSVTLSPGTMAQLLNTGSAVQLAVVSVPLVATNSPVLTNSFSGGNLNLSWPADHIGWRLLVQTNNLATGISANTNDWMTVVGSAVTNQISLPLDVTKPTEFYRLIYP
jgi:autotransporter-associated beta strand protein